MHKNYYITDKETWAQHTHLFAEHHWVSLPLTDAEKAAGLTEFTSIILVVKFSHEGMELKFRSHPKVEALPHMLSRRTLHPKHQDKLSFAGVNANDSTFDAMEKVSEALGAPLHHPIH